MKHSLFNSLQQFSTASGATGQYYSLPALEKAGVGKVSRLPVSVRIVLESVLRNCDGKKVTEEHVRQLANWSPTAPRTEEIPFVVARVVLQDFTGVPLLCDLGAIEAEAGMLGQPVYLLTPDVVGVHLKGRLREGVTATDLVLTVTELLRKAKVVGKFVEFFGEGAGSLAVPDRATIGNMSPEYGATMGFFAVDDKTVDYLRKTGRAEQEIDAFEAYFKAQGLFGMPPAGAIDYSQTVELDLATVVTSLAGPKRPQDRIELGKMKDSFNALFSKPVTENGFNQPREKLTKRYPTKLTVTPS